MPIGYRVVSYDILTHTAKSLMEKAPVDLSLESVHAYPGGIFLGTSRDFCQYYTGLSDATDLVLGFEYDEKDIIRGDSASNSEVLVGKAVLKHIEFDDPDIAHHFAHRFDAKSVEERRESMRGACLADVDGRRRVSLVRAMDARSQHLMPMDYVYVTEGLAPNSAAKRVLRAYEEGGVVHGRMEKALLAALSHAVTTAVYECAPQRVTFVNVSNHVVFQAPNPGEYFIDQSKPLPVVTLLEVSEAGAVTLPAPARTHTPEPH